MNDQEREQLRDDLQDAEVAVFRGMRTDQERIAELELRLEREQRAADVESEALSLRYQQAEARLAKVPALVEALRYCARRGAADSGTASKALAEWEKP